MRSNKNIRAVTVGIFVVIAVVIFIVAILALGGQRKTFAHAITIKAIFNDVNGLQGGSNIWFEGVKIGTVKKIRFNENALVEVLLDIEDKSKQFIRKNAYAKIGSDGLIGNKIVLIYGGSKEYPEVVAGDVLSVEKANGMEEVLSTLQTSNKNLLDITTNLKEVSKRLVEGKGSIGKLLTDESLAEDIQSTLAILKRSAVNAQRITEGLSSYTAKLQTKGSLTNDLVNDTVIFSRLRSAVGRIDAMSSTATQVVDNLNDAARSIKKGVHDTTGVLGVLLHDPSSAEDVKAVIVNLHSSSIKLDEDLEALQHNFLLRGFFKKREKVVKN